MGVDIHGTQFLLYTKSLGIDFSNSIMLGRQTLNLTKTNFKSCLKKFGFAFNDKNIENIFDNSQNYAEEFLKFLGAKEVHSLDYSDYEAATHIHDMNREIPSSYLQQYSVVMDFGSLEHVFNFPVAIKNCMEMIKVGGYFLAVTPANNYMGHGFYQFSPELFFTVFSSENGFEIINVIACETKDDTIDNSIWYSVKSPKSVNGRVNLANSYGVYLMVIAKKIKNVVPFSAIPQQSDYVSAWKKEDFNLSNQTNIKETKKSGLGRLILKYIPVRIKQISKSIIGYNKDFNPQFFEPFNPADKKKSALIKS